MKTQAKQLRTALSTLTPPLDVPALVDDLAALAPKVAPAWVPSTDTAIRPGTNKQPGDLLALGSIHKKHRWSRPQTAWLTTAALGQVAMMFGAAGAGRSETLLTLSNRAHAEGLGVIHVDPFGDASIYQKAASLLSKRGCGDELRVVNLMGGPDQTHRLDLIGGMDETALLEWCLGVIAPAIAPQSSSTAEGAVAQAQCAHSLFSVLVPVIVEGARLGLWSQHVSVLLEAMSLRGLAAMAQAKLPAAITTPLIAFLEKAELADHSSTWERMTLAQCQQVLSVLVNDTGAFAAQPNVNFEHSIRAGHFVLVLMPAMEKATRELMVMGAAIAQTLAYAQSRRPTRPHVCVLSDLPCAVPATNAQALWDTQSPNSLLVWSALDYPQVKIKHMTRLLEKSTIKIFMKNEDVDETARWFGRHSPTPVSARTLQDQREGQAHVLEKSILTVLDLGYDPTSTWQGKLADCPPITVLPSPPRRVEHLAPAPSKQMRVLQKRLADCPEPSQVSLAWCQETVARMMGFTHWHEATKRLG